MTVILHPPGDVSFGGDAPSTEHQERIARALRAAVQRAAENAARPSPARSMPDRPAARQGGQDLQETFDPARADLDQGIYRVPSYRDEGQPTGIKLLELISEAVPGYDVRDEPSPLEGGLIMSLPGLHYVNIRSPRYVTAGSLIQAYLLGLAVFGTTSFAILQGPLGSPKLRYWAVGTDPAVSNADLGEAVPTKAEPAGMLEAELAGKVGFVTGEDLEVKVIGSDGDYLTRGLVTQDRLVHWKASTMAAAGSPSSRPNSEGARQPCPPRSSAGSSSRRLTGSSSRSRAATTTPTSSARPNCSAAWTGRVQPGRLGNQGRLPEGAARRLDVAGG